MDEYCLEKGQPDQGCEDPIVGRHRYRPDFGERFVGRRRPCLFVADISTGLVTDIMLPDKCGYVVEVVRFPYFRLFGWNTLVDS